MNNRFLNVLNNQKVDRTPIWIMRQAGRYLPEYRKTREQAGDFLTLCKTPELACEVTLQPLRRFDLDAAILFSDILTIPDAMGLGLSLIEHKGPVFEKTIRSFNDVSQLPTIDPEHELAYVMDAARLIKKELTGKLPLIGFSGSPFTLATYMVEGQGSKTFSQIKRMLYAAPDALTLLLEKLTQTIKHYLKAQIAAGADAVMIFDTWGGILSTPDYHDYSLKYMHDICQWLKQQCPTTPIILFTKGSGLWLEAIAATGCNAIGLDWTIPLSEAKKRVGDQVALQGNLDPAALLAPTHVIEQKAKALLDDFGFGGGHIFNLGHGITPDINPEHVAALIETVHGYSAPFHLS